MNIVNLSKLLNLQGKFNIESQDIKILTMKNQILYLCNSKRIFSVNLDGKELGKYDSCKDTRKEWFASLISQRIDNYLEEITYKKHNCSELIEKYEESEETIHIIAEIKSWYEENESPSAEDRKTFTTFLSNKLASNNFPEKNSFVILKWDLEKMFDKFIAPENKISFGFFKRSNILYLSANYDHPDRLMDIIIILLDKELVLYKIIQKYALSEDPEIKNFIEDPTDQNKLCLLSDNLQFELDFKIKVDEVYIEHLKKTDLPENKLIEYERSICGDFIVEVRQNEGLIIKSTKTQEILASNSTYMNLIDNCNDIKIIRNKEFEHRIIL